MTATGVDGGTPAELPPLTEAAAEGRVVDRLVEVALARPTALAARDDRRSLTYAELLTGAAGVAAAVTAAESGRRPVAVLRSHGVGALLAAVGVLASGSPLVVLDPRTPAARLRHYVDAAGAKACVTDDEHAATAAEVCPVVLDGAATPPAAVPAPDAARTLRAAPGTPADPVLVVYTSGSTGRPKGVACDSRSILHDAWTNSVAGGCYGPGDVVANLLPMAFSAGIGLTLAGLLVGATQEFFDPRARPVTALPGWLREVGADVLVAAPAILRGVVAGLAAGERLDGLRVLTMAGETVHGRELAAVRALVGERCEIRNRYGSTETWLIAEQVIGPGDPAPEGATPVGRPVAGVRVQVEDEDGRLADTGTGRLVVTSRWLTTTYWSEPEATAAVYRDVGEGARSYRTSDTATVDGDGVIRLLGRTDHSVKVRGHLVEPGEVDAVLFARPEVREAVVVGVTDPGTGLSRLVAYVVPAVPRLDPGAVRRAVAEVLPGYMVPQDVVLLRALPRTDRGKLDRGALPEPPPPAGGTPARTDWERVVAALFARVLERVDVGIDDDFFALGGDSLAAESLLAAMHAELSVSEDVLTTRLLAENPTVAAFSRAVRTRRPVAHPTMLTLRATGSRCPLFLVAGAGGVAVGFRGLAAGLGPDQPVYALQAHGMENRGLPDWSVAAMARRHLRTVRAVQPSGPYRLGGHSLGALIALEMAQQLQAAGELVELLVVLDSYPPDPAVSPRFLVGSPFVRLKKVAALVTTGVLPDLGLGHYLRFHQQGVAVQRRYRGAPWPGRALVVVARDDPDAARRSHWSPYLTGPWSLHTAPGDHVGMLHEPNIADVVAVVAGELDTLDAPARDRALKDHPVG